MSTLLVVAKEPGYGRGISSRSEVNHAGIYYPEGSLKVRLCVDGRARLYRFCQRHRVPHWRCGKGIVATCAEALPELDRLMATAEASGVVDLMRLPPMGRPWSRRFGWFRPFFSPSTGRISAHGLVNTLYVQAKKSGALFSFETHAVGVDTEAHGSRMTVWYRDGREEALTTAVSSTPLAFFQTASTAPMRGRRGAAEGMHLRPSDKSGRGSGGVL